MVALLPGLESDAVRRQVYALAEKMLAQFEEAWAEKGFESVATGGSRGSHAKSGGGCTTPGSKVRMQMYNKVVKVEGEEAAHAPFYFVLHYVPDLHWCHLAPMREDGVFPEMTRKGTKSPHAGKKRWRLVPEDVHGDASKELDVSADRCVIMKRYMCAGWGGVKRHLARGSVLARAGARQRACELVASLLRACARAWHLSELCARECAAKRSMASPMQTRRYG